MDSNKIGLSGAQEREAYVLLANNSVLQLLHKLKSMLISFVLKVQDRSTTQTKGTEDRATLTTKGEQDRQTWNTRY